MDFPDSHRFVTPYEKAAATVEVREAYANGLIGDAEFERRMREIERSEDAAQLQSATSSTGVSARASAPAVRRRTLAVPHLLGAISLWVGPLLLWIFARDRDLKHEAAKALNFQLVGTVLLIVLSILKLDAAQGVVQAIFVIVGLIATVVVARGRTWSYPTSRLGMKGLFTEGKE